MATAMTSHILFIDLGADDQKPRVLRKFDHHRSRSLIGGRQIVKRSKSERSMVQNEERSREKAALETEEDDQEMDEDAVTMNVDSGSETDPTLTTISRMAISADGQWLATTDDLSRTYIFNLDSVQVNFSPLLCNRPAHNVTAVSLRSSIFPSTGSIVSL